MWDKLKSQSDRLDEIDRLLSDPANAGDPARAAVLYKERGRLVSQTAKYRELVDVRRKLADSRSLMETPREDPEIVAMAQEEAKEFAAREESLVREIEESFVTDDEDAHRNVVLEIRAGTGGDEAALFAYDLWGMYERFAAAKKWKVRILDSATTELKGYRELVAQIEGQNVYKCLRYESGTHRVQRVPKTEAQGRIHTSACTVAVMPEAEDVEVDIKPADIKEEFCRSGGPGGQNVNKVSTAVRLYHLPSGLVVHCTSERSQHQNRMLAMNLLRTRLFEMIRDREKAKRDELRRNQVGSGDRSEKIRTYNFPQNRITDHRIGFTSHNLDRVLDGNMDELVLALQTYDREQKLKHVTAKAS